MGSTTTIALQEHLDDELMLQVARAMSRSALYRPPGFFDGPPLEDDEDEERALFGDHDLRATDRGLFIHPEEECRSRRVDLRGPTDRDPGPLETEPARHRAPEEGRAIVLEFRGQTRRAG